MNILKVIKTGLETIDKAAFDSGITIDPSNYFGGLGENSGDMWMFGDGASTEKLFTYQDKWSSLKAYTSCPPVSAIINKKAQAYINGKTWITNTNGKANGKESTSTLAKQIKNLLENPNKIQSGKQFEAQAYSLMNLYGYAVILAVGKPFGYSFADAKSLWVIPNWYLDVFVSSLDFTNGNDPITKIVFNYGGKQINLPLEDIFILKDFTPCITSPALPSNRIEPMAMPINNVIGAYESRNVLINKRGPTGFLTQENNPMGNIPLTPEEKEAMQSDFKKYGLRRNQIQVILGAAALKWQSMGFDVNELGLFPEVANSSIAICNGLAFPPFLLGLADTTFNNQKEASRGLYQEAIIPDSENISEQLNKVFKCKENNIEISKDYSHIAALQEDRKLMADSSKINNESLQLQFKNNVITLNQWRTKIDDDPISDGFGDMYYYQLIKLGWAFGDSKASASTTEDSSSGNAPMQVVN